MMNTTFHADNFRQYKKPRGKPPSLHNLPDPPRYPTPTSLIDLPLTPNPTRIPARHSLHHFTTPTPKHQHPLPARPPAEVCATARSRPCSSRRSPGRQTDRTASESSIIHLTTGHGPISTSPSFNSNSDTPAPTFRGQPLSPRDHSRDQAEDCHDFSDLTTRSPSVLKDTIERVAPFHKTTAVHKYQQSETQQTITIDPTLLSSDAANEAIRLDGVTVDGTQLVDDGRDTARSSPDPLTSDLHLISERHQGAGEESEVLSYEELITQTIGFYGHGQDHQQDQHPHHDTVGVMTVSDENDHNVNRNREDSTTPKRPSRTEQSSGRPSKRARAGTVPHEGGGTFVTLQSHFLTLPLEERLQFLSWLFQGALSQCMHKSQGSLGIVSIAGKGGADTRSECLQAPNQGTTPTLEANVEPLLHPRKGRQWTSDEIDLLVKLRKEQNLPWSEVAKRFADDFPGRTQGAIQVLWSTKLKDRH
jgi:hypothetical protein